MSHLRLALTFVALAVLWTIVTTYDFLFGDKQYGPS